MFGYVKPYIPLLRVKDNEFYKAVYCGLCGCTAKCNGCSSTVTLSYDIAFLSLLRLALAGEKLTIIKKRCPLHPLKKRNILTPTKELEFCADVGVLLSYYNIIDNIKDEKGKKRFASKILKPFFSSARNRVLKRQGTQADLIIKDGLDALHLLEEGKCNSVDKTSDEFGAMLSKLASVALSGRDKIIAENAGYAVGKWIYIIDALDDAEKDVKDNSYNPVVELYGGSLPTEEQQKGLILALNLIKEKLSAALDLIDYKDECGENSDDHQNCAYFTDELRSVMENIVNVGMQRTEQKISESKKEK